MYNLTQGTIISGLRSRKYPGTVCNGIVISARCDLANCKIHNVYYLIAIPVDDWLVSDDGFLTALSTRINNLENTIETKIQNESLDWESMKGFTPEEFEVVLNAQCPNMKSKNRTELINDFKTYTQYRTSGLPVEVKKEILSNEKKSVSSFLLGIANGQTTHYAFVPESAYRDNKYVDNGLVVDLQELDRIDAQSIDIVCGYKMDSQNPLLSRAQIELYNNQFFLCDNPGYAVPDCDIKSPWIEYLMQRFSNSFIRIGVDGPQKADVQNLVDRACRGEEQ